MNGLPLHPAVVHVPLGLAFVIPIVALGLAWAIWREKVPARVFAIVVLLQVVVVGAGLVAMRLGEADEERVENVVPERAIHEHEEAAELFLIASGVTLALGAGALALSQRRPGLARGLMTTTALAGVLAAGLGLRAGHAGGELVYQHQAARALAPATPALAGPVGDLHDDDD